MGKKLTISRSRLETIRRLKEEKEMKRRIKQSRKWK